MIATNDRLEKKVLERKGARAEFELIPSDTAPSQRGCNSNDAAQPSHNEFFFMESSTSPHNDIERGRPENAPWEGPLQKFTQQPESICSSASPAVENDAGVFMDLGIVGASGGPGVDGIVTDLNNSGSNPTLGLQYQLLPPESNMATASWPNLELDTSGDSSYFGQWSPKAGASSANSNSPTASSKSSYQPQYQLEIPSSATAAAPGLLPPLLHVSAQTGNRGVLQSLLKHGAAVNEPDSHGRTALHVASEYGHDLIVSLLLAHGADCEALDRDGKSPLYIAVTASHNEVVDTLLRQRQ